MRRRVLLGGAGAVLLAGAGTTAAVLPRHLGPDPLPGLLTDASWRATADHGDTGPLAEARWLAAGSLPGAGGPWADMVRWALLDLRQLQQGGAFLAGPAARWRFSWPRDAAFAAAALSRTGHRPEALAALAFFTRVQRPDGGFEARYRPDGSLPDGRRAQDDGVGWLLWARAELAADAPAATAADLRPGTALRGLLDGCVRSVLTLTGEGRRLPPVSPDYWERGERRLPLGAAARLLAGLRAAARLHALLGEPAAPLRAAADRLEDRVRDAFGPEGYQRYARAGGRDAATCFLLPPFAAAAGEEVVEAWEGYQREAVRPAGGLAPGAGWKQDGISWTPEVGLVALTAAATGRGEVAGRWLTWLDAHRVPWGSLPEKVLPDGAPAGPAPLGWTAACVVLAVDALDRESSQNSG
ncbi:glycoside hydrolase family 15 [Kineococcus glutinatus]|uniref:Glycoside hydrolase family 15 n=1 Tax=Kineococcus glutinatus TaxID=1070872 RepID=A0ABP9HLF5_9ACTN